MEVEENGRRIIIDLQFHKKNVKMGVHNNNYGIVLLEIILLLWTIEASALLCPDHCGDVGIQYPFGIGDGCYFDKSFEVVCDNTSSSSSSGSPKAIIKSIDLEISDGSGLPYIAVNISVISLNGRNNIANAKGVNMTGTPFSFSQNSNRFTAMGCDNYAQKNDPTVPSAGGCLSICTCDPTKSFTDCCDLSCTIPPNSKVFNANTSYEYSESINQECTSVSMVEQDWLFRSYYSSRSNPIVLKDQEKVPAVLEWGKEKGSCFEEYNSPNTICNKDDYCIIQLGSGHFCVCDNSYANFPHFCSGTLICNTTSGHNCSQLCPPGYNLSSSGSDEERLCSQLCPPSYYLSSSGSDQERLCSARNTLIFGKKSRNRFIVIGCTAGGLGMLFLLTGAWWLYKFVKRRREIKLKQKFFKRNGGLLLQQELSSNKGNIEKTKLFTSEELEKATNNFNMNRILGQGGQGTVYKGMLVDGKIVAVKKSKIIDESKVDEFINEMVILSQINHRNVVKLLGCCLETQVPLLVYEFIPNGTLFQYLHDQNEEFSITWERRLRIAVDVSGAIYYLHSAASIPIYHRDIKSTNILLDDKYRAKVSDFGASRSIAVDQTHMTTQVQGTFGYLDPEYFRSSQFTEKSDVYSFGVVLAELLTGEKPIRFTNYEEDKSLAAYFLCAMKKERLFEILDVHVLKEGDRDEITKVAKLAKRCLNLNGKKRPTMREVSVELAGIRGYNGPSNVFHESLEEIDCEDGDITEISETVASFTESFSDSVTIPVDAYPLMSNKW